MKPALLVLLAVLLPGAALAQERPARDTVPPPPVVAQVDTVPQGVSPKGAFLRSLVLPGWGQSVVGSPGRGAVYFAMEAGSLWMLQKSRAKLGDARERQRLLREAGLLGPDEDTGLVESREEQVEDWATLSVFLLLFSAADAFVAAHLADFDEHVRMGPAPGGGLGVQASIPVGGRR